MARGPRYRALPPAFLPAFRAATPAFDFLRTLTLAHWDRAVASTPSGKLFEDPRNASVLVFVGTPATPGRRATGRVVPRELAHVSPFDSSVQGGDAVWGE